MNNIDFYQTLDFTDLDVSGYVDWYFKMVRDVRDPDSVKKRSHDLALEAWEVHSKAFQKALKSGRKVNKRTEKKFDDLISKSRAEGDYHNEVMACRMVVDGLGNEVKLPTEQEIKEFYDLELMMSGAEVDSFFSGKKSSLLSGESYCKVFKFNQLNGANGQYLKSIINKRFIFHFDMMKFLVEVARLKSLWFADLELSSFTRKNASFDPGKVDFGGQLELGSQSELVELVYAIALSGKMKRNGKSLTQKEIIEIFASMFRLNVSKFYDLLGAALMSKKRREKKQTFTNELKILIENNIKERVGSEAIRELED